MAEHCCFTLLSASYKTHGSWCQLLNKELAAVHYKQPEFIVKYTDVEQYVLVSLHVCLPVSLTGLSYGSHTVGFTPPATLSRAAISHYNTPALLVHGSSSHAVAVSHTNTHTPPKPRTSQAFILILY